MSVCELPADRQAPTAPARSRVMRFQPGARPDQPHFWQGVPVDEYKAPAADHCGVSRAILAGETGERTAFHVRYFEVAPGGFTTLEHHAHEHVVVVLRGRGEVRLGDTVHPLAYGDAVYVAPDEVHQLRNTDVEEPFGFLCMVDAPRYRPGATAPPV
jgi:quercetin dioxygenase-like cupin family protein